MELDTVKVVCVAALSIVASRSPLASGFARWSYSRAFALWRFLSDLISDPPTTAFVFGLVFFGGSLLQAGACGLSAFMLDGFVASLYSFARRLDRPGDPAPGHGQIAAYSRLDDMIDGTSPPQDLTEEEAHMLLDKSEGRK